MFFSANRISIGLKKIIWIFVSWPNIGIFSRFYSLFRKVKKKR